VVGMHDPLFLVSNPQPKIRSRDLLEIIGKILGPHGR